MSAYCGIPVGALASSPRSSVDKATAAEEQRAPNATVEGSIPSGGPTPSLRSPPAQKVPLPRIGYSGSEAYRALVLPCRRLKGGTVSCCEHPKEHNTLGFKAKLPHCEGCCREAGQDHRWGLLGKDRRPWEARMRHLHTFEPDGDEVAGKAEITVVGYGQEMASEAEE